MIIYTSPTTRCCRCPATYLTSAVGRLGRRTRVDSNLEVDVRGSQGILPIRLTTVHQRDGDQDVPVLGVGREEGVGRVDLNLAAGGYLADLMARVRGVGIRGLMLMLVTVH